MKLPHIATRLFNKPLLLSAEYAHVVTSVLAERLGVEPMVSQETIDRYKRPNDRMTLHRDSGIAILPVVGGMVHRGDGPEAESGLQSYTAMQNRLQELVDDRSIRGVLLDLDTPGGEVAGLYELASFVTELSKDKPIWAIANTTAASAGYWLAAAADRVYAAPGARVGSIGVYVAHVDISKQMEKRGIVHTFVYAGKQKVAGNPFEALPDDVRGDMQTGVNALWDEFADYVADRRGLTRETVQGFEARVYGPEQALELGLVDGVATLGQALSDFAEFINRPRIVGLSVGENMTAERLNHSASDMERARAEAHEAGVKAGKAEIVKVNAEFSAALTAMFPESKRAAVFAKALGEGASVALATSVASMVEDEKPVAAAPAPTVAAVDRMLQAHTPKIGHEGGDEDIDPKARRLAEIAAGGKAYSRSRGYTV